MTEFVEKRTIELEKSPLKVRLKEKAKIAEILKAQSKVKKREKEVTR